MRAEAEKKHRQKFAHIPFPLHKRKKKRRNWAHRVIRPTEVVNSNSNNSSNSNHNNNNNSASAAQSARLYPHEQTKMAHDMRTEPPTWTWNCFIVVALVGCSIYVGSDVDIDVNRNVGKPATSKCRERAGEKRANSAGEQCDVTW